MHPIVLAVFAVAFLLPFLSEVLSAQTLQNPVQDDGALLLFLELVVNTVPTQKIVPVQKNKQNFFVRKADLTAAGIRLPDSFLQMRNCYEERMLEGAASTWVAITSPMKYQYDEQSLLLLLDVPVDWLPEQILLEDQRRVTSLAPTTTGVVLNYDMYLNADRKKHGEGSQALSYQLAMWTEQRLFWEGSVLSNTGSLRFSQIAEDAYSNDLASLLPSRWYTRYDTVWRYFEPERMRLWSTGDVITGGQSWGDPVRIGGIRIAKDFSLQSNFVTYPLPEFSGQAALPSTVDLFINGVKRFSNQIQPGSYTLELGPVISGGGYATVVTTDALGREVLIDAPFYVSSDLLKPGLLSYAVTAGFLRRAYGLQSFAYGSPVSSVSARYGLRPEVTLEGQIEVAEDFIAVGAGLVTVPFQLGVANASAVYSQFQGAPGAKVTWGLQVHRGDLFAAYQGVYRSQNYATLVSSDPMYAATLLSQQTDTLTLGVSCGSWGSFSLSYLQRQHLSDDLSTLTTVVESPFTTQPSFSTHFVRAGYVAPLPLLNATLAVSWDYDLSSHQGLFALSLSSSIRLTHQLNASLSRQAGGAITARTDYYHAPPPAGGLGWSLAAGRSTSTPESMSMASVDSQTFLGAGVNWLTPYVQTNLVLWDSPVSSAGAFSVRGALVGFDNQLLATRSVGDAFAFVRTGEPGIKISYESQVVGVTNRQGYLLIPEVVSGYAARYAVEPLDLPTTLRVPEIEKWVAIQRSSGALLDFQIHRAVAASVTLIDEKGKPIAVGSRVSDQQSGQVTVVGYDGAVYFEGLHEHNVLSVTLPSGGRCQVAFALDTAAKVTPQIGPLSCQEVLKESWAP